MLSDENPQSVPKRWEEVKRWAAGLKVRALLVLDNCDTALEVQGGELFKKVVREIWEAGRGRLQLIITSQKAVAFANINFLPYPIRKLSLQASVTLLKRMVEGFGVEMSDEQAKTIGNLTDGCPLAIRIIGTELRSPKMGVPEMIHALCRATLFFTHTTFYYNSGTAVWSGTGSPLVSSQLNHAVKVIHSALDKGHHSKLNVQLFYMSVTYTGLVNCKKMDENFAY